MSEIAILFGRYIKQSSDCLICGSPHFVQFHHVHPKEKTSEVHKVARDGALENVINEINKCVPLCKDHHDQVHSGYIKGWLRGRFNNKQRSFDYEAQKFMPYLPWFIGKKPEVILDFYKKYGDQARDALASLFNTASPTLITNQCLTLAVAARLTDRGVLSNKAYQI